MSSDRTCAFSHFSSDVGVWYAGSGKLSSESLLAFNNILFLVNSIPPSLNSLSIFSVMLRSANRKSDLLPFLAQVPLSLPHTPTPTHPFLLCEWWRVYTSPHLLTSGLLSPQVKIPKSTLGGTDYNTFISTLSKVKQVTHALQSFVLWSGVSHS